jgi:ssDNA-binding Zn-finger/Zn-ribbon topoisomerase 1
VGENKPANSQTTNQPVAETCPVCGGFRSLSRPDGLRVCNGAPKCLEALLAEAAWDALYPGLDRPKEIQNG